MTALPAALRSSEQLPAHPVGNGYARTFGCGNNRRILVRGQSDVARNGARVVERRASGAWHVIRLAATESLRKGLRDGDLCGYSKSMTNSGNTTSTQITASGLVENNDWQAKCTCGWESKIYGSPAGSTKAAKTHSATTGHNYSRGGLHQVVR